MKSPTHVLLNRVMAENERLLKQNKELLQNYGLHLKISYAYRRSLEIIAHGNHINNPEKIAAQGLLAGELIKNEQKTKHG